MKRIEKSSNEWETPNILLTRSSYLTCGSSVSSSSGSPIGHSREELKMSLQTSYTLKSPPSLMSQKKFSNTCILQSRGIVLIRGLLKKYANRKFGSYLLLFILLPMCLATGGYEYFALHGLNSTLPLTYPSPATLPNHETAIERLPEIISNAERSEEEKHINFAIRKDMIEKLKSLNEEVFNLKEKLVEYDARIAGLSSELDLKIQGISMPRLVATLNSAISGTSESFRLRLDEFTAKHKEYEKLQVEKIVSLSTDVSLAVSEIEKLRGWTLKTDKKLVYLTEMIASLQQSFDNPEQRLLPILLARVEEKMKASRTEAEKILLENLKTNLIVEVIEKAKFEVLSMRGPDMSEVQKMINSAINLYDADKIGLADYALESSGGIVLSTRCTEAFNGHRPRLSIWGLTLWSEPNNPRVVIQPGIIPGHCWSFRGFDGYLVIQLSRRISPSSFTLEHIPLSLAPDGNIASAPRNFSVYGLHDESDFDGTKLGEYFYDNAGAPLQMFPVQREQCDSFSIVELRIHSNHGNPDYTCLYRFRVHGRVNN